MDTMVRWLSVILFSFLLQHDVPIERFTIHDLWLDIRTRSPAISVGGGWGLHHGHTRFTLSGKVDSAPYALAIRSSHISPILSNRVRASPARLPLPPPTLLRIPAALPFSPFIMYGGVWIL
ncbi:hypothetical protein M011DRAFT_75685 [Sporormia fimetaria CBS 119925]|uniref:Uncharacterized protein n=1 Tax=Sporormia fimetaria CBS 119925 TaxID=1340428 RepID=A0A6A6VBM0_9PLEO|nr:hypothetical protein M011DRAFT_75685 [Sporormia fimetaria CBS 119925]